MQSTLARFEAKFMGEPNSGCWLWMAYCNENGYGQFFYNGRQGLAHRASYELYVGPIPDGLTLDHLCRVRCCVNPQHLEPVAQSVNMERGEIVLRRKLQNLTVTHCPQGHPYGGKNLSVGVNGERSCKTCKRDRKRQRLREKRLADGKYVLPPASQRTHCPNGHAYQGDNLRIATNGQRVCKTCSRDRAREHWRKKNGWALSRSS